MDNRVPQTLPIGFISNLRTTWIAIEFNTNGTVLRKSLVGQYGQVVEALDWAGDDAAGEHFT